MSSLDSISRELLLTMEGIAQLLSQGKDVLNVARETNLDVPTVDGIVSQDAFHEVFRQLDERAYQRWVDDQGDLTAKRAVKNMARADSVQNYKEIRDTIRTSDTMSDNDKVGHLFKLLQIGGAMDKGDETEERVVLSDGSMELLRETLGELDGFFRKE